MNEQVTIAPYEGRGEYNVGGALQMIINTYICIKTHQIG